MTFVFMNIVPHDHIHTSEPYSYIRTIFGHQGLIVPEFPIKYFQQIFSSSLTFSLFRVSLPISLEKLFFKCLVNGILSARGRQQRNGS